MQFSCLIHNMQFCTLIWYIGRTIPLQHVETRTEKLSLNKRVAAAMDLPVKLVKVQGPPKRRKGTGRCGDLKISQHHFILVYASCRLSTRPKLTKVVNSAKKQ